LKVRLESFRLLKMVWQQISEEVATKILSEPEITATADIKMGDYSATAWGCDLTHEYININADYRS
jgi:glutamate N-acetyltransferase/amino-acid N-acetyltransferase